MKYSIFKLFFDFEKEEKWINQMAAKGFNFQHYSFCRYLFEEGKPGEYIYRIELLKDSPGHPESISYIKFMEELGIECVATFVRWVYFRKKATDGPFDLFSDYESRILHYKRVVAIGAAAGITNIIVGLINVSLPLINHHSIFNTVNFGIGTLNLTLAALIALAYKSYYAKMKNLIKERMLHE